MKRILVTGGAGFIGSHLCEELLGKGYSVAALDNLFSGSRSNIEHLLSNPKFEFFEHDITRPIHIDGAIEEIYNLACPASPVWYQKDPVFTMRTSVEGSINVLEFARDKGARVLQASTSEIYGDPLEHPQKETYRGNVNTLGPRACYDEGKRAAETLFMDYQRQYGLNVAIIRIFNTYGPRMAENDGRVVSNFISQALRGLPLTIYGEGTQTRSFQYVTDLIAGATAMMNSQESGPINLGNPEEFTMAELAAKVIELTGSKSAVIKERPLPEDDPTRRRPDISTAKTKLGWEPKVKLNEGLKRTIDYFKAILV